MAINRSKLSKLFAIVGITSLLGLVVAGYLGFVVWGSHNVLKDDVFFVDSKIEIEEAIDRLYDEGYIRQKKGILWLAKQKNIQEVHPHFYKIQASMNNNKLLNILRQGKFQTNAISVTIPEGEWSYRPIAASIASQLGYIGEIQEAFIAEFLSFYSEYSIDTSIESDCAYSCISLHNEELPNLYSAIIPNTYYFEVYSSPRDVFNRLADEESKWWSDTSRKNNLDRLGLTKDQVVIIASIVEKETTNKQEKGSLARVYINRISGPNETANFLQADPTTKFAIDALELRRVRQKETECDCPFNTYKVKGLPPAPICLPSMETLDAVLNSQPHDFYYFCADPANFNLPRDQHKHILSKNYKEHKVVAKAYQSALDEYLRKNP